MDSAKAFLWDVMEQGKTQLVFLEIRQTPFICYLLILTHFIIYSFLFDILFNVAVIKYLGKQNKHLR